VERVAGGQSAGRDNRVGLGGGIRPNLRGDPPVGAASCPSCGSSKFRPSSSPSVHYAGSRSSVDREL
jgi:hypothetical protein